MHVDEVTTQPRRTRSIRLPSGPAEDHATPPTAVTRRSARRTQAIRSTLTAAANAAGPGPSRGVGLEEAEADPVIVHQGEGQRPE